MKIYIDDDFKCHVTDDGTRRGFELPCFDGKCPEFVEGHRYVPEGELWKSGDGRAFEGEMLTAWASSIELDRAQAEYDRLQLADADKALHELGAEWEGE